MRYMKTTQLACVAWREMLIAMKRRSPSTILEKPYMRFAVIWRNCKLHFIRHPVLMIQKVKRKQLVSMTLSKSQKTAENLSKV